MALSLIVASLAATSVRMSVEGIDAATAQIEVQYGARLAQYGGRTEIDWCVAPMPRFQAASSITLDGLNQASRYYIRARPIGAGIRPGEWSNILAIFTPTARARSLVQPGVIIRPALVVVPEPVLSWYCPTEQEGRPARALGRDDPNSQLWAQMSGGRCAIEVRMSGAPIDTIALLDTNASEDCTITVKADDTEAGVRGGQPAYQSAPIAFRASPDLPERLGYHSLVRLGAAIRYRYVRIEVAGTVPGGLFAATYAVFGLARQTRNLSSNMTETAVDAGTLSRDRGGTPTRAAGYRSRTVEFDLSLLTPEQFETQYGDLRRRIGATDPVLVVPNSMPGPYLHDRLLYGTLSSSRTSLPYSARFNQSLSVDSLI